MVMRSRLMAATEILSGLKASFPIKVTEMSAVEVRTFGREATAAV